MAFGSPQATGSSAVKPPERGSFPLDRKAECKEAMSELLACLKQYKQHHEFCKHLTKKYLECRMQKNLMETDDFSNLGFTSTNSK